MMAEYRAYILGDDGHISDFQAFVCDGDTEATNLAKQLVDGHDVELWSGERFVIKLTTEGKPAHFSGKSCIKTETNVQNLN